MSTGNWLVTPAKIAPAPIVTNSIGKAQQIHVLALTKRLIQPNPAPTRGLSQAGPANEESSIADYVSSVNPIIGSINPVATTESRDADYSRLEFL
jgi:hypothetical protein